MRVIRVGLYPIERVLRIGYSPDNDRVIYTENSMKKLFIMIALLAAVFSVTSCSNTADGVGIDVEKAADAVKDATN